MDVGRTLSMARTILALPACTATVVMVVIGASCSPTSEKPTSMETSLTPASRCWTAGPLTTAGPSTTGPSAVLGLRLIAYRSFSGSAVPTGGVWLVPTTRDDALPVALVCPLAVAEVSRLWCPGGYCDRPRSDGDDVVSASWYETALQATLALRRTVILQRQSGPSQSAASLAVHPSSPRLLLRIPQCQVVYIEASAVLAYLHRPGASLNPPRSFDSCWIRLELHNSMLLSEG